MEQNALATLVTEAVNPASAAIDTLDTAAMLRVINDEDKKVALAVEVEIGHIAAAVDRTVEALRKGGRLFYIGAGTSGRLGVLDASECPPTYSVPPDLVKGIIAGGEAALSRATESSEDDETLGERDLMAAGFRAGDVVVGIAASGRTPYVLGALRKAKEVGGATIGISCAPASALSAASDVAIEAVVGPEVVTGSTRMKAGTATKLILNMISTGVMIRLGYVYGNLMVNVQPKNEKLVDRARRIISQAAGVSYESAAELLREAGAVRTAIVMAKRGINREQAEAALSAAGGQVRDALNG